MNHYSEAQHPNQQFLQELKNATRSHHRRVEDVFKIMSPNLTLQKYQFWLGKLYGFYAPLEFALDAYATSTSLNCDTRYKSALIIRDLSNLGVSATEIGQLPLCQPIPAVTEINHYLGVLYVLEGATLGGSIISKHLVKTLELANAESLSFFQPYGPDPLPHWQAFQKQLLELTEPDNIDMLISTACMTFDCLSDWLATDG